MVRLRIDPEADAYFPFGFAISSRAWTELDVSLLLREEGAGGANAFLRAIRRFADAVNQRRLAKAPGAGPVYAGHLMAFGLLEEILRYLTDLYCFEHFPGVLVRALEWTGASVSKDAPAKAGNGFVTHFPPTCVHAKRTTEAAYHAGNTGKRPNQCLVAREMILLRLAMENPALKPFRDLFDDAELTRKTPYVSVVSAMETFFDTQPPLPLLSAPLFQALRAPMRACPDSIEGQLDFIRAHWAGILPPELMTRLLLAQGMMEEERRMRGMGPGPAQVLEFNQGPLLDLYYPEPARFSSDRAWMANLVLIAKVAYVWLDQLSRKYGCAITRLDQVPDEELDRLARWGFTGLWLIGVWERSCASQKIKQRMGNPEAAPSAYSLYDYVIASDLGGEAAYENLRERAQRRGIRLASDMVPNHVGIYSRWVIEHPDWFIQCDKPPFPSYRFTGPDLSDDGRVALVVEDGYWDKRDAAVVFKRVDKWTGGETYIYHGNDGTSMPWNDTAQLNFLLREVREAVIQTIVHVARKFPIIRFDAAMTLAKKHYQRLWFPQPGDAGAVPSRAEHSMSRGEFERCFPNEFWREVVDRVTTEAPDTLLLAEAFWLMEGYFVRTLGMHRVYNSAFMNMLKMEENSKYRQTVKNVLEFSPAVLQRFVNFMNNPDELTAVEQFGKGDKYFGAALMMVTMPGLPMFGHGQIEGFTEKYGMEYRRAYWDEPVDEHMVRRHEAEIFPLMRKRHLFSGADNFALYDFIVPEGWVDENVFAYSNRYGDERALILYHNAYSTTVGHIHTSTPINVGDAHHKTLVRKSLAGALGLGDGLNRYCVFRDYRTGLEYVRSARGLAENGLHMQLHAYQYCAFLDFRECEDLDGSWARLEAALSGNGVPNAEEARQEVIYGEVLQAFAGIASAGLFRLLLDAPAGRGRKELKAAVTGFAETAERFTGVQASATKIADAIHRDIGALRRFRTQAAKAQLPKDAAALLQTYMQQPLDAGQPFARVTVARIMLRRIAEEFPVSDLPVPGSIPRRLLQKVLGQAFTQCGADDWRARMEALLAGLLLDYGELITGKDQEARAASMKRLFADVNAQRYLQFNRYHGILWLRKEPLETLVNAVFLTAALDLAEAGPRRAAAVTTWFASAQALLQTVEAAQYQAEKALELFSVAPKPQDGRAL
jgi:glycosidase